MACVKRFVNVKKERREVLELASGYHGQCSRLHRKTKGQILHPATYAYRDRRAREGDPHTLRIQCINAAACAEGMACNRFINGLKNVGVRVGRKILVDLAVTDAEALNVLVAVARENQTPAAA